MRRLVLALTCTLTFAGLAALPSANAAPSYGISDQQAITFINPLFTQLKLKQARYVAPYDVMSDTRQLGLMDTWIKAAKAAHERILISFEHSRASDAAARKMPSISAYTKAMKAFNKVYGKDVKDISPWNEVNHCQTAERAEGQPNAICKHPEEAAKIYKAGKAVFKGKSIVVLDFLDGNNPSSTLSYIKKFKKAAKPSSTAIWGLHNYSDTNRYKDKTQRTKKILKEIGKGQIWLTETGGQVTFQKRTVAEGAPLAAKALGCMFYIAKEYKQIKRVYIYSFNGTPENQGLSFDSGLVASDGTTKRPGWKVVKDRKSIKCNK